ncbi:MAG: MMPL family transporter [Gallionellaceae bacterium]|nr:MMPL family transporter [Gallionellaceae bacterium]
MKRSASQMSGDWMPGRWIISCWLAFIIACIVIISRTEFETDLSAFLPRSPTPTQKILVEQLRDGIVSRLILVGLEGDQASALAQTSKKLAAQLRQDASFAAVDNGEEQTLKKDRDLLWHNRYLLSPAITPEHFSVAALHNQLEDALQLLGSPVAMLTHGMLEHDPSGELIRLLEQFEGSARPAMQHGVWFSRDGKRALLLLQTAAAGYDIDAQERVLLLIHHAFDKAVNHTGNTTATGTQLLLSGPGVFSVQSRASIKDDALHFSLLASALIALLLLALYRSPRVLILGLLPVVTGALAGISAVSLGFGSVHGITLGFGVTLIGEGVDYAIYLFTQITPTSTPKSTLARIWPTLRLGVLTSICGFSAMLLSSFPGLAQLGLFSIAGLITAVLVTRWVLPVLLPPGFTVTAQALTPPIMSVVRRAPALRTPLLVAVVLALAFIVMQQGPVWSDSLSSMSPMPTSAQLLDGQLRNDMGAPDVRYLIVVSAKTEEAALQMSEKMSLLLQRLTEQGMLDGYESPSVYFPSRQTQQTRLASLPNNAELRKNLQQALQGLPFRAGLFEPFLRDIAAAKEQPLLDRTSLQGSHFATKLDALLVKRDTDWTAMLPLRGVTQPDQIKLQMARLPEMEAVLLDLKQESENIFQTYRHEAVNFSLLGAVAIVMLLLVSLRSPRRVLEVLAPLIAAVIIVTAILVWSGHALSIFHLVGLLLVVAVGSNYALFFDRKFDLHQERGRMIASLVFANVSTVIGFGLLTFSHAPVLSAIGSTVGLGAILSLVFSAILIVRSDRIS